MDTNVLQRVEYEHAGSETTTRARIQTDGPSCASDVHLKSGIYTITCLVKWVGDTKITTERDGTRLTVAMVLEIADLLRQSASLKEIALKYNVSGGLVERINTGKAWRRVFSTDTIYPLNNHAAIPSIKGNRIANYKLTETQVRSIWERLQNESCAKIAKSFGVSLAAYNRRTQPSEETALRTIN